MKMNQSMLYMRYLSLLVLVLVSFVSFGQAPSNYTNINGRYRWIAGMFDSTFHIPKGSTPSLRTGGSTNAGALFYRTSDSTVRYWTGSQWLTLSDTTRFVPYVGATKDVDLDTWSLYAKSLHIKGTAGQGHLGLKFQSATPNMSANESGVYADASGNFGIKIDNAYTSIFKTNLNSADRTYTFQNKSYTVADSADVAAKIEGTLVSGYLTKATGTKTIDTSQIYQTNGKIGIGRTNPTAKVDITDSLGTALRVTNIGPYGVGGDGINVRVNGWSGYAALIEQRDSSAAGTQYQTVFRKGMLPGYGNPAPGGGVAFITQIGGENEIYKNLTVYRGRMIDSTGYSVGQVKGTSQEIWTRKNGVWDTTLVLNQGNVGVNTGQNGIDSALTVANGTWLKRGVRMSALPTGVGTKSVRIDANGTLSVADTLANGVSGSLVSGYLTKATGTNTIDTSQILQSNGNIGIGSLTYGPQAKLQVSGNIYASNPSDATYLLKLSPGLTGSTISSQIGSLSIIAESADPLIFRTNNTERARLDANGNLGVGLNNPDSNLTVNLGTHLKRGVRMSGLPTGTGTKTLRINASGTLSIADTLANGISGTGTTNYISKFTGSTSIGNSQLVDNGSTFYYDNGLGRYAIVNASAENTVSSYTTNANAYNDFVTRAATHQWRIANSERMRLDASGNLGLGTSSPSAKLDVVGSAGIRVNEDGAGTKVITIRSNFAGVDPAINVVTNNSLLFLTNNTERMRLDASGNLGLGVTPSAWGSGTKAIQIGSGTSIWNPGSSTNSYILTNAYNDGANFIYRTSSTSSAYHQFGSEHRWYNAPSGTAGNTITFTQAMTLDASGRLGIGTTSPENKLTIIQNTTAATENTYGIAIQSVNTNAYTELLLGASDAVDAGIIQTAAKNTNFTAKNLALQPQGGKVGIGTTSPSTKLQVQAGTLLIETIAGNSIPQILLGSAGANYGQIQNVGTGIWALGYGASSSALGTNVLSWNTSGNVGIGTTSPGSKLEVNATGEAFRLRATSAGNAIFQTWFNSAGVRRGYFGFGTGSSSLFELANEEAGAMSFSTSATERMRITSGGNVGIGTTNPATKLVVSNGGALGYEIDPLASSGTIVSLYSYDRSAAAWRTTRYSALDHRFEINGTTEAMRLNSGGELLINTTSDAGDYKLQVAGQIYSNISGAADNNSKFEGNGSFLQIVGRADYATVNIVGVGTNNWDLGIRGETTLRLRENGTTRMSILSGGAAEFSSSIKTAAPSGGTAKPFKIGAAAVVTPTSPNRTIEIEIDGVTYYLTAKTTND